MAALDQTYSSYLPHYKTVVWSWEVPLFVQVVFGKLQFLPYLHHLGLSFSISTNFF